MNYLCLMQNYPTDAPRTNAWTACRYCVSGLALVVSLLCAPVYADEDIWHESPHHFSIVLGNTWENGDEENESAATFGFDYEYRVNQFLGLGGVVEQAIGDLDTTTALLVADLHLWRGLALQTGPGIEFIDRREQHDGEGEAVEHEEFVYRVGFLYELENEGFTVSPQVHVDITDEAESFVFVLAFGLCF